MRKKRIPRFVWRLPLICVWLLIFAALEPASRGDVPNSVGSLDFMALLKLATRVVSLAALSFVIVQLWQQPNRTRVIQCFLPFGLFAGWGIVSTLWSPLFAVSLGQVMSFSVLVLLAVTFGLLGARSNDTSVILCSLSVALLLYSVLMSLSYVVFPSGSAGRFAFSLAHPSTAGTVASLGLIILIAVRMLWGWRWSSMLLVPGWVVHGLVLFLAVDRTSILLAAALVCIVFFIFVHRAWLSAGCVAVSLAGALYLALDPGLNIAQGGADTALGYLTRGQTTEQLGAFSGRDELWQVMWQSALESPWIGHGYFVTSSTGALEIWGDEKNYTAHNAFFQVFVTTGVIGFVLFVWALWRPLRAALRCFRVSYEARTTAILGLLVSVWVLGWGMQDSGIVMQTLPPTVVFFTVLGLVAGQLPPLRPARSRA